MSIRLMTRVWDETRFKGTDLLILLCLADHANDEGRCWPSYQTLAERARCSRRQAIRCVLRLSAEGWVSIERRRIGEKLNQSNVFHLKIPSGDSKSLVTPPAVGSDNGDPFGASIVTRVVTSVSPKPSGNHKEPSNEPVLVSRRAIEKSSKACPDQTAADEHVLDNTGLDGAHAIMCSEKWYEKFGDVPLEDWRAHLSAFADKFESDYRK